MRIKFAICIFFTLIVTGACIDELEHDGRYGKVVIAIGDVRPDVNNPDEQTRATVDGEWIKGDKVGIVI